MGLIRVIAKQKGIPRRFARPARKRLTPFRVMDGPTKSPDIKNIRDIKKMSFQDTRTSSGAKRTGSTIGAVDFV